MSFRIGVLGGGQLGRMLALAGYPLGLRFRFYDVSADAPAGHLAELHHGDYSDHALLERFARDLDLVTYEFENVPLVAAEHLAHLLPLYPSPGALAVSQDRLVEKDFFRSLQIPVPEYAPVSTYEDLMSAIKVTGLPAVLKTRRFGYDGKGQVVLNQVSDAASAWTMLESNQMILERYISFEREVSIVAVRGKTNNVAYYPVVQNWHREGILRMSVPIGSTDSDDAIALQQQAQVYASKVLSSLDYVGVLAIEFFVHEGKLLVNEMAPRVHNSGHWTIEGAETSQFENHLRAIAGMPLGAVSQHGYPAMLNIIGDLPDMNAILEVPGAHVHLYDKMPRPARKLGHITICADNVSQRDELLERLTAFL